MDDWLLERIELARGALAALPDGALVGWVGPARHELPAELDNLDQLAAFLRAADGAHCHEFILYGVEDLGMPGPQDWLPGGAARWLTVGRNHVFPLCLDRETQRVVELDAEGGGEILRDLGPFGQLVRGLFGGSYLQLSHGLGEEWDALLRRMGESPQR
jgi:hypothetical protein